MKQRSEVFVKIKKKLWGGAFFFWGGVLWFGGQGGCE